MRVLLLGVGGFIGSHLVDRLLRDPSYEVEGLDLSDEKLEEALLIPKFKFVRADIRHERETTLAMIDRADVVVDMIAHANADLMAQADPNADSSGLEARYPKAKVGDFDGNPQQVTEMDALVAYLQMLGTLVDFKNYDEAAGYR